MTTTAMEARLAEIGRRIDHLYANARDSASDTMPRIQRHADALWEKEASARAAVRDAYRESRQAIAEYADSVDYRLKLLELELEAAEASLRADVAEDAQAFCEAAEEGLEAIDLYLERLQTRAASKSPRARVDAEDALRDLRRRRNVFAQRLEQARTAPGEAWRELKPRVAAARAELRHAIDEAAANFD